jgi:ribonuclease P/MRP protein subunit RPP1
MRKFLDLNIRPLKKELRRSMLELAADLGYKGVGLTTEKPPERGEIYPELDLVSRVNLRPSNVNDLMNCLRRIRRKYVIIAVECHSKNVARQAAKDNRVDILNFPVGISARRRVRFDRQEASLAGGANCVYEVNVSDLLGVGPLILSRLLSMFRKEVENAKRYDVPVIVSSGADEPLMMREPRSLAAVLSLLGLDEKESLDAVSTTPWGMAEGNREKLGPGFVMPGVRRT